jgi:uncharacterized protein (TIGR03382 family)
MKKSATGKLRTIVVLGFLSTWLVSATASGFCGFYVSDADKPLYNQATQVVMMRQKNLTVLSMENNYEGPLQDFALVIPVPVVLKKENVKTLPAGIFRKVDQLDAPRLVEYWERDPCMVIDTEGDPLAVGGYGPNGPPNVPKKIKINSVTIEAKFSVGEYSILVLSASDSSGLETWLHQNKYKIPKGSEPYLRPYVAKGSKFFVAKVDSKKVKFENGRARLSPLRFHYNSNEFSLPIRLGLINAQGKQELIIHILSPQQRYEVANYPNEVIPTNLNVADQVRSKFGTFYAALFDRLVAKNPKAVVSEYAWDSATCDPCPTPPLGVGELTFLGNDVLESQGNHVQGFVLTRLHARYSPQVFSEDLIFKEADPMVGGREFVTDSKGAVEQGFRKDSANNFQARYVIRHPWEGEIACANPKRGIWGGPPANQSSRQLTMAATDIAFVARDPVDLSKLVLPTVLDLSRKPSPPPTVVPPVKVAPAPQSGCAGCSLPYAKSSWPWLSLSVLGWMLARRRRRASYPTDD